MTGSDTKEEGAAGKLQSRRIVAHPSVARAYVYAPGYCA